jgi:uncharacterized membrane protein
MSKNKLIGILVSLLLTSIVAPSAYAIPSSLSVSLPYGTTYERGDTLRVQYTSYAADTFVYIQIQKGSTVLWADQHPYIGANTCFDFEVPNTWYGGTYTVWIKGDVSGSSSLTFNLNVPSPPVTGPSTTFAYSNLQVSPQSVQPDEPVTVTVTVTNTGGQSGTASVELKVDGVTAETKSVTLYGLESRTVTFTVTKASAGTYTVAVGSLTGSFTVTAPPVPPEPAEFIYSNLQVSPQSVQAGEPVTVTVTVTNTGGQSGTDSVELKVDGVTTETKSVTLNPGQSTTVTWTLSRTTVGTYAVAVGSLTGSFTVTAPPVPPEPAEFIYSNLQVSPQSVQAGEPVTVTVTVTNTGGQSGTDSVELKVDGVTTETKSVTLNAGASSTVTWTVTTAYAGTYTVAVGSLTGSFTVTAPPVPPTPSFPWEILGLVVVFVGGVAYFLYKRQ